MPLEFFTNDMQILQLLREGDEEALVMLYRSNRRMIESLIEKNHGTKSDAEDMLQEALIVLWERVRSGVFVHNSRLSTFIYATAKNLWLRQLSRHRREITGVVPVDTITTGDPSPLERLIDNEEVLAVHTALSQLGNPCRQILLLYYWEELPLEEIAHKIGFANADTVKSKKYQCKKALEQIVHRMLHYS